jgi:hypothetical protein
MPLTIISCAILLSSLKSHEAAVIDPQCAYPEKAFSCAAAELNLKQDDPVLMAKPCR